MHDMEEVYKEYFQTVKKYLFCLTHDNDIAEELTQETFYRAVKKINTFHEQCKISVWLCQIAKNLWYDYLRKMKKSQQINETEFLSLEMLETVEDSIITSENKINLYKKIQLLDHETREIIYLRIAGDLTFKEIGNILDKNENWVRVKFYRGKQKLKEVLKNER